MKQETVQNIVKRAKITKTFGVDWVYVYMDIYKKINETKEWRSLRANNSIFVFKKDETEAVGYVFTVDPPLLQGKNFIEFAKALRLAGYEQYATYAHHQKPVDILENAGYTVEIGDTLEDGEFFEIAVKTAPVSGENRQNV